LRQQRGTVWPVGLYDLDRNPRPVGKAYKQLIADWREVLPAQSVCLTVPLAPYRPRDRAAVSGKVAEKTESR